MQYTKYLLPVIMVVGLAACQHSLKSDLTIITQRIQYDVPIKSPNPEYDWWVQNIEGSQREDFVNMIFEAAYSGKVRTYDYFNHPLTPEQVRQIGYRRDTITMQRPVPPYTLFDTVIEAKLDLRLITRIRFLEEWTIDKKHFKIVKNILGIAPLMENYSENGELRGYMPLFWIYTDKRYPKE
jgi:hypothetical protein